LLVLHFSNKNKREKVPQVTKQQSDLETQILMDGAKTVSQFGGSREGKTEGVEGPSADESRMP
jgi:hypothetical protein